QKLEEESKKRLDFYNAITEQEKAEFINGEIIIHSPVKKFHNEISGNLYKILDTYVIEQNLGFVGIEKILVQFTRNDYEPDICYFHREKSQNFTKDQSIFPVPDLIIEILSEGTEKRERGIKFEDYQAHGVKEYWIIDPKKKTVEQYAWREEAYELVLKSNSGTVHSMVIQDLAIPITAIFDGQEAHQLIKRLMG
ncbi:MAG: Uma2 family endonuclease, partial [Bacteroidota bacterium]